ncbi:MAG: hypothetical protein ACQESF_02615 [Nanobdellota archaeon]
MEENYDGMKLLQEHADLLNQKEKHEKELKRIKARISEIETLNADFMLDKNLPNLTLNGRTLYLKENVYAKKEGGKEKVISALKKVPDFADLVGDNFNANSLNARIRECYENGEDLPEEFEGVISIGTDYKVGSRKAA